MARILVIDDSPTMRQLVRRILNDGQHSVIEAQDGDVGLALFRQRGADLVITDLFMPNREGIETIKDLRRLSPTTRIVAMSTPGSGSGKLYLGAAKKLGADAILEKPFQAAELLSVVERLLANA